ncbi:MAG: metallophosphatase [Calditrichia bacterium]
MKRRDFIKSSLLALGAASAPGIWIPQSWAQPSELTLTLLQTNDTHSRIDPFPMDGGRNQGMGGIARRATLVKQIRAKNPNTLLLDGGDVLQGTPYFNMFHGELEYKTMTQCGYDATTLGNHEFDNGVESLAGVLKYARFPIVNCNYDFGTTPLRKVVRRYLVKQFGDIKVGITGIGVDFTDLVAARNHAGVTYQEPYRPLQKVVDTLRNREGCAFVVVLSHLGYKPYNGKPGDTELAYRVDGVDWIVGAHSHTFMDQPDVITSKNGHKTHIFQVGWAGIYLGRTDIKFINGKLHSFNTRALPVNPEIKPAQLG